MKTVEIKLLNIKSNLGRLILRESALASVPADQVLAAVIEAAHSALQQKWDKPQPSSGSTDHTHPRNH